MWVDPLRIDAGGLEFEEHRGDVQQLQRAFVSGGAEDVLARLLLALLLDDAIVGDLDACVGLGEGRHEDHQDDRSTEGAGHGVEGREPDYFGQVRPPGPSSEAARAHAEHPDESFAFHSTFGSTLSGTLAEWRRRWRIAGKLLSIDHALYQEPQKRLSRPFNQTCCLAFDTAQHEKEQGSTR